MTEEWRPYSAHCTVSSEGRVITRKRIRKLTTAYRNNGKMKYLVVSVKGSTKYVHQMVCEAFHGPKPGPDFEVRHLNGDSLDNRNTNLAWGTKSENQADRIAHQTTNRGVAHPLSRINEEDVREIRRLSTTGALQREIAAKFDISPSHINAIIRGRHWSHIE